MREFLGTQAPRVKKIGQVLAPTRAQLTRPFLVAEPPLDHIAHVVADEYFQGLPVVLLSTEGPVPDGSDEADTTDPVARHQAKGFRKGDVLLVFAHAGEGPTLKTLLQLGQKKR